ncbi:hypothetical protein DBV15_03896 [Temnothorax longispinosus]|uniref:Uncharacterized protein n=1 Tax=Temnothorax longispinosus TaxID=300112 RepID=A0A4S2KUI4_9HYME|nr:hypothetical protein DBV15_03896 [Temnothorax longispinosus]
MCPFSLYFSILRALYVPLSKWICSVARQRFARAVYHEDTASCERDGDAETTSMQSRVDGSLLVASFGERNDRDGRTRGRADENEIDRNGQRQEYDSPQRKRLDHKGYYRSDDRKYPTNRRATVRPIFRGERVHFCLVRSTSSHNKYIFPSSYSTSFPILGERALLSPVCAHSILAGVLLARACTYVLGARTLITPAANHELYPANHHHHHHLSPSCLLRCIPNKAATASPDAVPAIAFSVQPHKKHTTATTKTGDDDMSRRAAGKSVARSLADLEFTKTRTARGCGSRLRGKMKRARASLWIQMSTSNYRSRSIYSPRRPFLYRSAENANDRSCATRPNRILSRKEPASALSLKSIQRYVIEWPFFSDVRLDGSGCARRAGMVTENTRYVYQRPELVVVSIEGPELYGRMYPASGLDSSGTASWKMRGRSHVTCTSQLRVDLLSWNRREGDSEKEEKSEDTRREARRARKWMEKIGGGVARWNANDGTRAKNRNGPARQHGREPSGQQPIEFRVSRSTSWQTVFPMLRSFRALCRVALTPAIYNYPKRESKILSGQERERESRGVLGTVSDVYTLGKPHGSGYPNSVPISCGLYDFARLRVPSKKNVTETIEARHAPLDTKVAVKLGI